MMDRNMGASLDRYITGNYGEDQFKNSSNICQKCEGQKRLFGECPKDCLGLQGNEQCSAMKRCPPPPVCDECGGTGVIDE